MLVAALTTASPAPAQIQTTGTPGASGATTTIDGRYLPPPPAQFHGDIQPNADQSKPVLAGTGNSAERRTERLVDHDR